MPHPRASRPAGSLAAGCVLLLSLQGFFPPVAAGQSADLSPPLAPSAQASAAEFYNTRVKPLLAARCYACHGALKESGGLRLDTAALLLRGGDSGAAVEPGNADASLLLQRTGHADPEQRMPPPEEGEPLTAEELAVLRTWIDRGAVQPEGEQPEPSVDAHWSFRPCLRPAIPQPAGGFPSGNPIDAFLGVKRAALQLDPQPAAPRATLVRRLYFDLTGLPPTRAELAEAEADQSPDWYDKLVDALLESPRYAERWARHWMDIWRYADGSGLGAEVRNSHASIWHWRDWIVESVEADLPYDEMVRQMLAADELFPDDLSKLRATGLLVRNYNRFSRTQWLEETVEHVGKAFLGLTFNCARCHDHKYDPIEQAEYFRLRAVFEPFYVRVDTAPEKLDAARGGIPRVFDASLDVPTYRLIRGQESQPDTSAPMTPGMPKALAFASLEVQPVSLPAEAVRPELRTWVAEEHAAAARRRLLDAESRVAEVQGELVEKPADADVQNRLDEALWEVETARAAWTSVHRRIAAFRAQRAAEGVSEDDDDRPAAVATARLAAVAAVRAEREEALVAARKKAAEKRRQLTQLAVAEATDASEDDRKSQRESLEKEAAEAQEAVAALEKDLDAAGEQFTPLPGAVRVETRHISNQGPDPVADYPAASTGRRAALARWITHPDNPLTARVAVNHMWTRHMGAPLAPTVFDFGRKGAPPDHPELLDWLACEFRDSGWSMKHMHRLIVRSATYRLSSSLAGSEANAARDPENRTFWRRIPLRLESQSVRDALLAIAGDLDCSRGGPPVAADQQAQSQRRSLYFLHSANDRNTFLSMFDDASTQECYRREESIVPQQALALSNSRLAHDLARKIARNLSENGDSAPPTGDEEFIRRAFAAILSAHPAAEEVAACSAALAAWRALPEAAGDADPEARSRSNLVRTLFNHNDFVTLR